jgi:RNA polymerase sigma-70 factor (ECF subfamily)
LTGDEFAGRIEDMTQTLYRVSYSMLAQPCDREDAVQEAIRRAWEKRDCLRDERYMQTWVVRILINVCRDMYARRRRETPVDVLPERTCPEGADADLHDALMRLSEKMRLPIVLHYMEGYDIGEIAGMLRLPTGTVKTRMRKARTLLREMLSEEVAQ